MGIAKCGCCGASYVKISRNLFGCAAARNKGTCDNRLNIRIDVFEAVILDGLRHRNHTAGIAAADLFVVPTIALKLLYCMVVLAHQRRELVHHAITTHPTAEWVARQIIEAFPLDTAPRYLVRDRDAVYGPVMRKRLRALRIRDRPTAPRSPWQNAYVERLIGSIRHECLDHVIVLGESHLRRIVSLYAS